MLDRGRGGAVPPPPPGRGTAAPGGTVGTRTSLPTSMLARGVSAPRARGTAGTPGYRTPLLQATHETYDDYVSKPRFSITVTSGCENVHNVMKRFSLDQRATLNRVQVTAETTQQIDTTVCSNVT